MERALFKRCAICGQILPDGATECTGCGVHEEHFTRFRIALVEAGTGFRYRILELPLEMERNWFRVFYPEIKDPDGNPIHRYVAPARVAGLIERSEDGGAALRGRGPVTDSGNHLRVNGEPAGEGVWELRPGVTIELWSAARGGSVLRLVVEFEEIEG